MSGEFLKSKTPGSEDNRLDDLTVKKLESSLPQKAKELYEYLKSKATITLYDARKDPVKEPVKAYTRTFSDHYEIWLDMDFEEIRDSFIHEIGQVNAKVLGYKNLKPRGAYTKEQAALNGSLATFARNAFIFYICERELQKYGIDRSLIKQRAIRHFEDFVIKIPSTNHPNYLMIKQPYQRALLGYNYVPTRLFVGSDFDRLEILWKEKVKFPEVRKAIRTIYLEASREEITPERYSYLQRFFAKTLELGEIFE